MSEAKPWTRERHEEMRGSSVDRQLRVESGLAESTDEHAAAENDLDAALSHIEALQEENRRLKKANQDLKLEIEVNNGVLQDTYDALEGVEEADDTDHPLWIQKHVIDSVLRPEPENTRRIAREVYGVTPEEIGGQNAHLD